MGVQREALAALKEAPGEPPRKVQLLLDGGSGSVTMMASSAAGLETLACKVISVSRAALGANRKRTSATLTLVDKSSGGRLAVISAAHLTALRTAATACLAAQFVIRPDATSVGLYGSGHIATLILEGLCNVMDVSDVQVYSPTPARREAFAEIHSARLGVSIRAVNDPDGPASCDVIVAATTSLEPVFSAGVVSAGTTILSVSSRPDLSELPPKVFSRARVLPDSRDGALLEAGDVRAAIAMGSLAATDLSVDLTDVVRREASLRSSPEEIWIYKGTGLAIQDAFTADVVYRRAVAEAVGTWFDFEA